MLRGRRIATAVASIILPINGDTEHLKASIESLRSQTYTALEIVIVSTSSSLITRRYLNQIAKEEKRVTLVKLTKGTPFQKAAENGVRHATGSYLLFAEPSHLHNLKRIEVQALYLQNHPSSVATYCQSTIIEKDETKRVEFHPFSLLVNRGKLPFIFNPYDPRCIRELSSYGAIGAINNNLLVVKKLNVRVATKTHNAFAAFFKTKRKAIHLKKYIRGVIPSFRLSTSK